MTMESFPIPGGSPPGVYPPPSAFSSSDSTYRRPPDATSRTTSKTATAKNQPHNLHELPKLGDFSSLSLYSAFTSARSPHDQSVTTEELDVAQSISPDASPTTTIATTETGRVPYNILSVPKLGNFSSLGLSSPSHPARPSLDQPVVPAADLLEPDHPTASSQASLGDFSKLFELLGYLSPPPSTSETANMKKTDCPYVCPGARKAAGNTETSPIYKCPHARACEQWDKITSNLNWSVIAPSKSPWKDRPRYSQPWNRSRSADTDSDWRSGKSTPSPAGYETGLTTPPLSPTRNNNFHRRGTSSPVKTGPPFSTIDDDVAFEYVLNEDGPRVAVKKSDIQRKIQSRKRECQTKNDYPKEQVQKERTVDKIVAETYPRTAEGGVHIFADVSNIFISLLNTVKKIFDIPSTAKVFPNPEFNWDVLRDIACRGRCTKTLKAGCSVNPNRNRNPAFIRRLNDAGFEVEVRERVLKHTGQYVEELVDESIQLNIGQCIEEHSGNKGTLVLVTGDGKPAEHSSGFKAYAEYALKKGWNVEVVCWTIGCSRKWKDETWDRYGQRYRLITLDHYLDDLWDKDY